jgi:hypothetical protein
MTSAITDLLGADPRTLLDDLKRIREQEQLLVHERELVERVLEILIENGGPAAEWLTDPARGVLTVGPLRSQILGVMRTGPPNAGWQPRDVHAQLVAHGNSKVTLDNVRVTMNRMATGESPELLKPEPELAIYVLRPETLFSTPEEENDDDVH